MLSLLVLVSLTLVVLCPLPSREQSAQKSKLLQVSVSPRDVTFYPEKKLSFKCRVKGTYPVTQSLDVGFYMLLKKNTVMPLSSGTPGIEIRTTAIEGRPGSRFRRTVIRLTLYPEVYDFLEVGKTYFCCRGYLAGNTTTSSRRFVDYFVVRKKPRRRHTKR